MRYARQLPLAVAMGVLLAGCATATQVSSANEQLMTLYTAKVEVSDPAMAETVLASLKDLSEETAAQARSATDPLNRISLYRIAATAAWQAGDAQVVELAREGIDVCEEHWNRAPRDCGLLVFVADLAAVDETTASFNTLDAATASATAALEVLDRYEASARSMIGRRSQIAGRAPATLVAAFDDRLDDLICVKYGIGAIGLAAAAGAEFDGACRLANLRVLAGRAGAELPSCSGNAPTELVADCD